MISPGIYTSEDLPRIREEGIPKGTRLSLNFSVNAPFSLIRSRLVESAVERFKRDFKDLLSVDSVDYAGDYSAFTIHATVLVNPILTIAIIAGGLLALLAAYFLYPTLETIRVQLPTATSTVIGILPILAVGYVYLLARQ